MAAAKQKPPTPLMPAPSSIFYRFKIHGFLFGGRNKSRSGGIVLENIFSGLKRTGTKLIRCVYIYIKERCLSMMQFR
jgi:hypothetical protein